MHAQCAVVQSLWWTCGGEGNWKKVSMLPIAAQQAQLTLTGSQVVYTWRVICVESFLTLIVQAQDLIDKIIIIIVLPSLHIVWPHQRGYNSALISHNGKAQLRFL